jgi:Phosphoesterase family
MRRLLVLSTAVVVVLATVVALESSGTEATAAPTPIQHVVVFFQENHSYNNILGMWCAKHPKRQCDGTTTGTLSNGQSITLKAAPDVVPSVNHNIKSQTTAIDGGKMNGFDRISGCQAPAYSCYSTYKPTLAGGSPNPSVQNVISLAKTFAISDMTFEPGPVPSWGEHLGLVTGNDLDGFSGNNPTGPGPGWGCDSGDTAQWSPTGVAPWSSEPSCVPAPAGSSEVASEPPAVQTSPVPWVPTMMDDLQTAGRSFKIYGAAKGKNGYGWAVCPTFADCLYTNQSADMVPAANVVTDAQNGTLPNFSLLMPSSGPTGPTSQHNGTSMAVGDNWIGQVISAIENGPDWDSTAIFLTWDDCGCFYDSVAPPANLGIRVPMIMISPWVIGAHTDHHVATWASILAFTEHVLGVPPLNSADRNAYDYLSSFNFAQTATQIARHKVVLAQHGVSAASLAQVAANPPDPSDPT